MSKSIVEIVDMIRQRHAMYIGRHSITRFHMYLHGYLAGLQDAGETCEGSELLSALHQKVQRKCGIKSERGWPEILLFEAGTEEAALELFWEVWDEHLAEQARKRKKKSAS